MELPSGRKYDGSDLALVRMMAEYGMIQWSNDPFKLNSGIYSNVYVFGREDLTDHPDFEWKVGLKSGRLVQRHSLPSDNQPCLIGIPTAGTAIANAAALVSHRNNILINGHEICHRVMRETLKRKHGVHPKWVNGNSDPNRHTYWSVDNVVTNADSKFTANERLQESGYPVEDMPSFVYVDRQQGGIQRMEKAGIKRIVIAYYLLDLTYAFGELRLWPKDTIKAVEDEIAAHQF